MKPALTLTITAREHKTLQQHLFSGDGLEAAAILICGRAGNSRERLCVHSIINVPYDACPTRTHVQLVWPGEYLEKAIERCCRYPRSSAWKRRRDHSARISYYGTKRSS